MSDDMALYRKFGAWVRAERRRCGVTQAELAELLGLARASIANIEVGRQRVLLHHAVQLLDLFRGVHPPDWRVDRAAAQGVDAGPPANLAGGGRRAP